MHSLPNAFLSILIMYHFIKYTVIAKQKCPILKMAPPNPDPTYSEVIHSFQHS